MSENNHSSKCMKLSLKILLNDTRLRIFYILLLIWVIAVLRNPNRQNIIFPGFSIILFSILDLTFHFVKTKKWYYPFSSFVSGLLIGLIIHASSGILAIIFACIFGFLSKQFIKLKNHHIFNPAAFGIILSSLVLGFPVAWWAVASGGIFTVLLIFSSLVLFKLKRLQFPITFLMGYFIFFAITHGFHAAMLLTIDGTIFLFTFVMLPEPMTSSINGFWKWGFGSLVILGVILSYILKISFADPLLLSLLFANLMVRITYK